MSTSPAHFLCVTTGAPTAGDEPVTTSHLFGTTTVSDSESLEEVFSASDMLRRGVKADSTYRAVQQGNERDDEVPYREAGWRAGRRGGERDDRLGIAIEATRGARRGWDGGTPFWPLEMVGSYRKATEILSKSISVTPPRYRNLYRIWVEDFATDPSPIEILPKTYRNPLQSGLPKPKILNIAPDEAALRLGKVR
jgi:hypothetical protein